MTSDTKSKATLPEPFTRAASQRLRRLAQIRADAMRLKATATKSRDDIAGQIAELGDSDNGRKVQLKAEWHDECQSIKRANAAIKRADEEIHEAIDNADQQEFWENVNPNPSVGALLGEGEDDDSLFEPVIGGGEPDPDDDVDPDEVEEAHEPQAAQA